MYQTIRPSALFVIVLLLTTMGVSVSEAATPADAFWETKYYHAGVQGTVYSMLSQPGALYVGGYIAAVGEVPARNVARLNTSGGVVTGATALGDGLSGKVAALCEHDGQVIAGGFFTNSGGTQVDNVALWDGAAWQAIGEGLPGVSVRALASFEGDLYAGAYRWDGAVWTNVLQTDGAVTELVVHDGLLYVGGDFSVARGDSISNAFAWDGAQIVPMGAGLDQPVLSADEGVSGVVFATGDDMGYGGLYRWDGASWIVEQSSTLVWSVACYGTSLVTSNSIYIGGGQFQPAIQSNQGGSWAMVGEFTSETLCEHEGVLFLGARENDEPGVLSPGLIGYNGSSMQTVFSPGHGYDEGFYALAPFGGGVLAGGDFVIADGQEFDGVALSAAGAWSSWGARSDLATSFPGVFENLEVVGVEAFGVYQYVDWDVAVEVLAKTAWTGTDWQWQLLDPGGYFSGDLVAVGSELFNFNIYGVNSVDLVTGACTPLPGLALDGRVSGACAHLGDLVICGKFTMNGGIPVSNVLRYAGGVWQDVGAPLPGSDVDAVAPLDGARLAASIEVDGVYRTALFDGVDWTVLEGDFNRSITNLLYHRDRLFAGGSFDWVGPTNARGIAVWTGTEWAPVGIGLEGSSWGRVEDMISAGDHLWVAGRFTTAGGHLSVGLGEWTGDPTTLTGDPSGVPDEFPGAARLLGRPYPNPFNPRTTVSFELPQDGRVQIGIFDVRGAFVRTLTDEVYAAGNHAVVWNGEDDAGQAQPSGVYFARFLSGGRQEAVKLTLVR